MLVRAKTSFEGFDNAMQPQKPHWESVQACLYFSFEICGGFCWSFKTQHTQFKSRVQNHTLFLTKIGKNMPFRTAQTFIAHSRECIDLHMKGQ